MSSPLDSLILGLGLFFLGMRLVGDNLRSLCSGGFQEALARTTRSPFLRGLLGLAAGALMQSATAVTFICVSMVSVGLLTAAAAAPVIVWSNVGLTALAFAATLDIHPIVAFIVGGSGIALGIVRVRTWQTVAGALLGVGLILMGLEQMSAGAQPLKQEPWFQWLLSTALGAPAAAFCSGIALAAILQSNTGAAMMLITLAGAIPFEQAALVIYGTNLGAILLRIFLAADMHGEGLRLVRLEDAFCLFGGVVMLVLAAVEGLGVPLVFGFVEAVAHSPTARLALVFLLSNLVPAALLTPFLPSLRRLLEQIWPGEGSEEAGTPRYLRPEAVADPPLALHLLRKESARLLALIASPPAGEPATDPFDRLGDELERFAARLGSVGNLTEPQSKKLLEYRAILSLARHAREALLELTSEAPNGRLAQALANWCRECSQALDTKDRAAAEKVRDDTKHDGDALRESRMAPEARAGTVFENFRMAAWSLHRLAKVTLRILGAK